MKSWTGRFDVSGLLIYRTVALHAAVCVMLAGCALTDILDKIEAGQESGSAASKNDAPPAAEIAPEKAVASRTNHVSAPRPRPKPIGFSVNPQALVNLDESRIRELMGAPAMVREEPPAVIWSYLRGECRLDVYLYENLSTKILRSLTYVVETSRQDVAPEQHCLQQLN